MRVLRTRRLHTALAAMALLAVALVVATSAASAARAVEVQFLDVSDWHGQIDPLAIGAPAQQVGGAAALSAYFTADRAANPDTITLTGGDDFGASPPLSGFFEERPGVLAERLMGIQVSTFGNHNFDRGIDHLQQMVNVARAPSSTAVPGEPYRYVSANLRNRNANLRGVRDFRMFRLPSGVRVAVVGITNPEAPELVKPGSLGTIVITDPVAAAMRAQRRARERGADIVVVVTHMGVTGTDSQGNATGPLVDFANAVRGFDVVFGDHTDVQYQNTHNGQLVVENLSKGASYSKTLVSFTKRGHAHRVTAATNTFVQPLVSAVTPDPAVAAAMAPFRTQLAAAFDAKIAVATNVFVRGGNIERRQEVPIGNLVADSMRLTYGTQLGLTNAGGIRAPLPSAYTPLDLTLDRSAPPPFDLVVGDVFTVLPFGNEVVTQPITGAQLWNALENGVSRIQANGTGADGRFPQISGFRFSFDSCRVAGSRVMSVSLADGTPIANDASATYSIAINDFVQVGGDGYTVFNTGQGVSRDLMANVLLDHIRGLGTLTPATDGRIANVAVQPCAPIVV